MKTHDDASPQRTADVSPPALADGSAPVAVDESPAGTGPQGSADPIGGDEEPLSDAQSSAEAARRGAVILEVLAGVRGATAAAEALGISVNYYYHLERQAVQGLVKACEPQPKGRCVRTPTLEQQLAIVRRDLEEARREALRQSALVRATQRAMGLPETATLPVPATSAGAGGSQGQTSPARSARHAGKKGQPAAGQSTSGPGRSRRARRPTVRALTLVSRLEGQQKSKASSSNPGGSAPGDRLQPSSSGPVHHATDRNA